MRLSVRLTGTSPQACLPLEFALNGWYTEPQRANDWDPPAAQEAAVAIIVHRNYLEAPESTHDQAETLLCGRSRPTFAERQLCELFPFPDRSDMLNTDRSPVLPRQISTQSDIHEEVSDKPCQQGQMLRRTSCRHSCASRSI